MSAPNRIIHEAQYRLSKHYLERLRHLNDLYQCGYDNATYALASFDQELDQIRQAWKWAVLNSPEDVRAAEICSAMPVVGENLLSVRLTPDRWLDWLATALAAAQKIGDLRAQCLHLLNSGRIHEIYGNFQRAFDVAQQALMLAQECGDKAGIALALHHMGVHAMKLGDYAAAQDYLEQSVALGATLTDQKRYAHSLHDLGMVLRYRDEKALARSYYEQSLQISRAIGYYEGVAHNLNDFGLLAYYDGDFAAAVDYMQRAMQYYRVVGQQWLLALCYVNLGVFTTDQGELDSARAYLKQALPLLEALDSRDEIGYVHECFGNIAMLEGDYQAALDAFLKTLTISRGTNSLRRLFSVLRGLALVYAVLDQLEAAYDALREAVQIVFGLDAASLHLNALTAAVVLWQRLGQPAQATEWAALALHHPLLIPHDRGRRMVEQLLPTLRASLPAEAFKAAWERGKNASLALTMEALLARLREAPSLAVSG